MDSWSSDQQLTISVVVLVLATISALSSTLVISTIIFMGKFRKSYWRQVIGLIGTELLQALSMVNLYSHFSRF